jgi:hypothetical protein
VRSVSVGDDLISLSIATLLLSARCFKPLLKQNLIKACPFRGVAREPERWLHWVAIYDCGFFNIRGQVDAQG